MAASLCGTCASLRPTVPVLVISGMEDAEAEYEGLDTHFRLKPLLPDNLLASVHRLLTGSEDATKTE